MRHDVIYRRDPDGTPVIGIKLENRPSRAWLNRADYEALQTGMGTCPWFAHGNGKGQEYVRVSPAPCREPITVARLIVKARLGRRVTHANGDRLDLRASNLITA